MKIVICASLDFTYKIKDIAKRLSEQGHEVIKVFVEKDMPLLGIAISIFSNVLAIIIGMGLIKIALRFCDNEKAKFAERSFVKGTFARAQFVAAAHAKS